MLYVQYLFVEVFIIDVGFQFSEVRLQNEEVVSGNYFTETKKKDKRTILDPLFTMTMTLTSEESTTDAEANIKAAEDDGSKVPLFKFILTGGPCGGKTTAIARLSTFLRERGFEVIACAEVYTILASNGMSFDFYSTDGMDVVIQNSVLDVQLSLEDSLERVLRVSSPELG